MKTKKHGAPPTWRKLEKGRASAHFAHHFAPLAPTPACQKLLEKLATHVTQFETVFDDGDPELIVHFGARASWRCFEAASPRAVSKLPGTYAGLLRLHNGLVHRFNEYTWDDLWLMGAEAGDGDALTGFTAINARDAYFYEFVPKKVLSNGEPAIGLKTNEGRGRSRRQLLFTELYGAPGLFLRLCARELLGRDELLLGGFLAPD